MNQSIQLKELQKSYGKTEVLKSVDLSLEFGRVYGLIGNNGAGKTTMMRIMAGLMKPTNGIVTGKSEKDFIGYMPQSCRYDDSMTVHQVITYFTNLRNVTNFDYNRIKDELRLPIDKKVKYLSPGQQKKLQFSIAVLGNPDFYLLDEPTAGLDPAGTQEMLKMIKQLHDPKHLVVVSSHNLHAMEQICTNILILEDGQITYDNEVIDGKIEQIALDKMGVIYA